MKYLIPTVGNLLLNKDVDVIGHQCNCQNTMGSGIARSIKEMYPEAWDSDVTATKVKINTLGNFSLAHINASTSAKYGTKIKFIFNLYGQNIYGKGLRQTDYEAIYSALEGMASALILNKLNQFDPNYTVGFPFKMASDRGGARWEIIQQMISVAFENYPGNVVICKL
jgi:O-acetyl-ADP-ribose deacetylase (regulator of RNase III)